MSSSDTSIESDSKPSPKPTVKVSRSMKTILEKHEVEGQNTRAAGASETESATTSKKRKRKQSPPRRLPRRDSIRADGEYKYSTDAAAGKSREPETESRCQFVKYHPESKWQEPYDETSWHGLTMYEVQRQPRVLRDSLNDETHEALLWEISSRKHHRGRKKKDKGDSITPYSVSTRIRCDYQDLLEELRCVICFGTLRQGKMVRECLHRFCENCIETCLRRFRNNACPVCRIDVPSRRSLVYDVVFNTLIEAFVLREAREGDTYHQQMVDEAMAIAASLEDAIPSKEVVEDSINRKEATNPQLMIATNRRLRLEERRRQQEIEANRQNLPAADVAQAGTAVDEAIPPLVELLLKPHPTEIDTLPTLELPYLRLAGNATIGVLETFLKAKLGPSLLSPRAAATSPWSLVFYFSQKLWRRPLTRKTQLHQLQPGSNSNNLCILYYRRTKLVQQPNASSKELFTIPALTT